jgi:flagellar hook-associated protein FlgK
VGDSQYYDLNSDYSSLIPDITSETDMTDLYSSLTNAISTSSDLQTGDSLITNSESSSVDIQVASIIAKSTVSAGEYTLTMMDENQLQMEDSNGKTQTIDLDDVLAGDSKTLDFYQFGISINLENLSTDTVYTAEELVASLDGKSVTVSGSSNALYYYGLNADNFVAIAPSDPNDYYNGSDPNISADNANTVQKMSSVFGISVSSLVNDVGIQVATWTNSQKADDAVLSSLKDQRDAVSGVNLDEEAANLLKYQQLYSASTKVLQTGNQMFNTLLSIMN